MSKHHSKNDNNVDHPPQTDNSEEPPGEPFFARFLQQGPLNAVKTSVSAGAMRCHIDRTECNVTVCT